MFRVLLVVVLVFCAMPMMVRPAVAESTTLEVLCPHSWGNLSFSAPSASGTQPPRQLVVQGGVTYTGPEPPPMALPRPSRERIELRWELTSPEDQGADGFSAAQADEYRRDLRESAERAGEGTVSLNALGGAYADYHVTGRVSDPWEGWEPVPGRYDIRIIDASIELPGHGTCALGGSTDDTEGTVLPGFFVGDAESYLAHVEQMESTETTTAPDWVNARTWMVLFVVVLVGSGAFVLLRDRRRKRRRPREDHEEQDTSET